MSLATARKSDEVMGHLHRLRHDHGWFKFLLENTTFINPNIVLVLMALDGGNPVGVLMAHGLRVGIFVDPGRRREGIGTVLMDEAYRLLGPNMSVVLDDDDCTRFFMSLPRDMHLCMLPGMGTGWAPREVLDTMEGKELRGESSELPAPATNMTVNGA